MKNKFIIVILALIIILPAIASAYTLLQPLPQSGDPIGKTTVAGLSDYLTWLYKFALGAAIFLAVLKIVIGGVLIIVGGASENAQSKGRDMIEMALWGLLLALCAWLLLNAINPDFIKGKFGLEPVTIERGAVSVPSSGGFPGISIDNYPNNEAAQILNNAGIRIESSGNCFDRNIGTCTSLEGIPKSTITKLVSIAQDFRQTCSTCDIAVTGGTEVGHSEHGLGLPVLDLNYSDKLAQFLNENKNKYGITKIIDTPHGTGPHIHVVFNL